MPDAKIGNGKFNICHISPPSYNSEVYEEDNKNQSVNMFQNKDDWYIGFLFKTLNRIWNKLEKNGYLIVESILFEDIWKYIRYRFPEAVYLGTISVKTGSRNKPMWIFMNLDQDQVHEKLPSPKQCLDMFSPSIRKRLINKEDIY